jgi:hypothetical protein
MSDKIKILFCPSDRQGVGHFRTIWPAQQIARKHSDEFEVSIEYEIDVNNIEYLSKFDIIHFHRALGPYEKSKELFAELKRRGVTAIMDIDDYWTPPSNHHIYQAVKADALDDKIVENIKNVEMVTTTTELFADEIEPYNSNVHVMPNALRVEDQMWKSEAVENKSGKVRIAWIGGSSHKYDLMKIQPSMSMLNSDVSLKDKYQIVLCGFDVRGTMTEIKPNGEKFVRPINKEESVWLDFEKIFTSNYSLIKSDPEYVKFLNKIKSEDFDGQYDKNYVRRWTLPLTQYGKHYDYCDICLAPIAKTYQHRTKNGQIIMKENTFNKVKCIVGDSLISTDKGIKHIEDIVNQRQEMDIVLNFPTEIEHENVAEMVVKKTKKPIVNHFKYENVETIKITTKKGYTIEGTPHHRIMVDGEWVELSQFEIGNVIELSPVNITQSEYQFMSYPMLLTKNMTDEKIQKASDNMLPKIKVNEDWGRFIGYMLGDGNYTKTSIKVTCDERHTKVVNDVKSLMTSMGLNPLIYKKKVDKRCSTSKAKEGFGVDVACTCVTFIKMARKYGLCGPSGKSFRIPKIILESPKSVIREFLRGLFESDGTVGETRGARPHSNAFVPMEWKDEIVSVEHGKNTVYDIEVDEIHAYNANGIINHNSELKIIESGVKKKVLVAQNYGIYGKLIKHGENGILIDDDNKGWYKEMKRLINEPDYRNMLADNLHKYVMERYTMEKIAKDRVEFYKEVVKKKKEAVAKISS